MMESFTPFASLSNAYHSSSSPSCPSASSSAYHPSVAPEICEYFEGGAGDESTLRCNRTGWKKWRIRPRMLLLQSFDLCEIDTSWHIDRFNRCVSMPLCIAPVALQQMLHVDGEKLMFASCYQHNLPFILSTSSSTSIEHVRALKQDLTPFQELFFFQLYLYVSWQLTLSLILRAKASGANAIVLTVDAPRLGLKERDLRNKFVVPQHITLSNFEQPELRDMRIRPAGVVSNVCDPFSREARFSWKDLRRLKQEGGLPVILKGILTAEDALLAFQHEDVDGIIVSNHGGRQLDTAIDTAAALVTIVAALRKHESATGERKEQCRKLRFLIGVDGGIADGCDIFKALALGADFVCVGRPAMRALSKGKEGLDALFQRLQLELKGTMLRAGVRTVADIMASSIRHQSTINAAL